MIKKASVIISLGFCGLCLAIFVWVRQRPAEHVERPEHQQEGLKVFQITDEAKIGSKLALLETNLENIEQHEEVKKNPVLSRMPAGYQPDQLSLIHKHTADDMDTHSIRRSIDQVTGVAKASNFERFRALADLYESDLPASEATRLLDYLKDPNRYKGMSDAAIYVLINQLVAVFHDQPVLAVDYLKVSAQVINDKSQHEVVRDYTLQGLSRGIGNATDEQAEAIRAMFWNSLKETDTSLAGTALLALNRERKSGNLSEDEVLELEKAVAAFLKDADVGERTRIPAMSMRSELGADRATPDLKLIFHSKESTPSEKIAALSALNSIGDTKSVTDALNSEHPLISRTAQKISANH